MIGADFLENGEVIVIGGGSSGSQSRELVGICCRKFYLLAVSIGIIAMSSCTSETAESETVDNSTEVSQEEIVEIKNVEREIETLNSEMENLKTTTEETKEELDELLNDL